MEGWDDDDDDDDDERVWGGDSCAIPAGLAMLGQGQHCLLLAPIIMSRLILFFVCVIQ